MAPTRRPYGHPEDGHKKSDDTPSRRSTGMFRFLKNIRKRRLVIAAVVIWALYLFVKHIPTDLKPAPERVDSRYGRLKPEPPSQPVANPSPHDPQEPVSFDQPIRYFELGLTLRAYKHMRHSQDNVLFALSSPKSSSDVITAACAMAKYNRTNVHVAMMGKHQFKLDELLALNSIPETECPIIWHDARPDFAEQSTDERMFLAVDSAVGYISQAIPQQAFFFDQSKREDTFLRDALQFKASHLRIPSIGIPHWDAWLLSLDARSLRHFNHLQIDILIHVPRESAGGLLRLLRTIRDADYGGMKHPRIIIELPAQTDPFVLDVLSNFQWPPGATAPESRLIIRRQIETKSVSRARASLKIIESYYPANIVSSHVVLLSSDVELAPGYYQYLVMALLENKYSTQMSSFSSSLMGVSLERLPQNAASETSVVLWQRPSSQAALYVGDKWRELQEFLSYRFAADPELSRATDDPSDFPGATSAWVRLASELMQARGYFMLHPPKKDNVSPLITVHQELQKKPGVETDLDDTNRSAGEAHKVDWTEDAGLLTAKVSQKPMVKESVMLSTSSIMSMLGEQPLRSGRKLISADDVSFYSINGDIITWNGAKERTAKYANSFSQTIGGCSKVPEKAISTIEDLFCVQA